MNDKKITMKMIVVVLSFIILSSVNANAQNKRPSNLVFWSDIIEIPHETVVVEITGVINILKDDTKQEGYKTLKVGEHIEENDIIEVTQEATVVLGSGNSTVKLKKQNRAKFFTFKYIK